MKRLLISILTIALALAAFAGCSAQPSASPPEQPSEHQEAPAPSETAEETASAEPSAPQEQADAPSGEDVQALSGETVFGKVKSIVGNEIELEVANPPFDFNMGGSGGEGEGGEGSVSFSAPHSVVVGDEGGSAQVADAGEAGESGGGGDTVSSITIAGPDGSIQTIGGGSDGEKMELEYTGETKNIIIPAGVDITNLIGGDSTLESIKKGSVLMMTLDDTAGSPTANSVMIME